MLKQTGWTVTLATLFLAGCSAPYQSVQGSYSTPDKRFEGAMRGATGVAILTASKGALAPAAFAGAAGGVVGWGMGDSQTFEALLIDLHKQGVDVILLGDALRIILPEDYFFKPQSFDINPAEYKALDTVAALLKEFGKTPIHISAYTDAIGSIQQQHSSSQARAQSILTYLWVHGLESQNLYAKGYGAENPIATNDTSMGKAANRRVEITLRRGCPSPVAD